MPLLTFDIIEGRSATEIRTMLDAAHRAVLTAFNVPERDRYQIVHENKNYQMVFQDTGLGFERSDRLVSKKRVSWRNWHGNWQNTVGWKGKI